ncbi:ATP-binding protein [Streptomyces sp. DH10]|uniref:ATP-binding protein n=1 Tax=Streptomyces sp. DH10 TaxID=3040121 RepID=UPI0024419EEC|nr:LuxR family transcriptional regulator [Streptomyces sp. DH10]MDG9711380.1 AAA family ATPase [Streptomyces sp. DH10]
MPDGLDRVGAKPRLLEREGELRCLGAAIAGAKAGRGAVVALEGSAGIGKTRLLRAAMELAAESGVAVVSARGGQMETEFAFGVARQLFEPVLTGADNGERELLLEGAAAPSAWLLGGGRADRLGEPVGGGDRSFATLHGLYGLTAKLAARAPLMIVVDDAHWADVPSLRFLGYLARRVDGLPVLLTVAVRPEDPGAHGLLLTELVAGPEVEIVRLGLFTLDAVRTLLQDAFAAVPLELGFVRGCWTMTGGNPFLVTQLIGALRARGAQPTSAAVEQVGEMGLETVSRWTNLRLAGLPPSATALAAAVAVLGDGADVVLTARLAGLDPPSCDEAVDGLVSISILRVADGLAFTHPLVRWAIYAGLPPRRRAREHREAARLLWHAGGAVEHVASHLLAAAPAGDGEVVDILIDAARSATRKGAPDLAVRYLKRALAESAHDTSRPELLRELGTAEQNAGQFEAAAENLRRALECTDDMATKIEIAYRLRTALVWSDRAREVAPALDGLIAEATERDSEGALLLEAAVAGALQVDLSTPRGLRDRVRQVASPAFAGEPVPPHISSLAAVEALFANEPAARVLRLAEEAVRSWYQAPEFARGPIKAQLFVALILAESHSLARRLLDDEVEDARRHGSAAQFLNAAVLRSTLFHRVGMLAEAEADARAALEAAHLHPGTGPSGSRPPAHSLHAPMAVAVLVDTMIERGKTGDAERLLTETGLADADSPLLLFSFLIDARARLRAAQGRTAETTNELLALGARMEGAVLTPAVVPWRSQAALALAGTDADAARRLAREELELARVFGAPGTLGVALRAAALTGAPDERVDLLRESVAVLEDSQARLEWARSLVELGASLRRRGRRSEARTALESGMDGAWSCGATALAQRASEELRAGGARPRRLALTGVDALTGAERGVAGLAAQGLTNRQIAEALVISLHTVETHLRHVFHKLDITSRKQLAEHLDGSHEPASP